MLPSNGTKTRRVFSRVLHTLTPTMIANVLIAVTLEIDKTNEVSDL